MSHQSVSVTAQHKQKQTNKNKQTTKQKQTIVDSPRIDPIDCDRFKQIIARILQTNINETCPSIPRYMQNNSSGGGGVGGGNINNEGDNDNYNKKNSIYNSTDININPNLRARLLLQYPYLDRPDYRPDYSHWPNAYGDSDVFERFHLFAQSGRSPLGIAQALVTIHWGVDIENLPSDLVAILRQTGPEYERIPVSGFEADGDSIHHSQLQAYNDAIAWVTELPRPDILPLLQELLRANAPTEQLEALTDLRRIIEERGPQRQTALTIFQLVHTRARYIYLQDRDD
jgi:hypothetical protein